MKAYLISKIGVMAMLLFVLVSINVSGQTITVDTIKNTLTGDTYNDLLFRVGDSTVMTVAADRNIKVNTNIMVQRGSIQLCPVY